ncbi:hypothetical protein GCM10007925_18410 [Sphingomonas astaxanthinifaciens DSM 22298]|uniref:Uncharacterized protein n=1 Tax=Sphingomonas astaxanthinifaciens DSM 22298 TaxID=1123267 RepID=A0ABQ5Z5Z3_9SPHN|nr:hypothetical protein GCM10007925_18410 [Sphingomonas astaxanthinifaciens DSM 22298]
MMRGGKPAQPPRHHPQGKHVVAGVAGTRLPAGTVGDFGAEGEMGNAEPVADVGDLRRLGRAFGPEAVIDRRDLDVVRPRAGSEEQQGEAVGPSRYRKADPPLGSEPVERGVEEWVARYLHPALALAAGSSARRSARMPLP